jgi:VWFA-related protein
MSKRGLACLLLLVSISVPAQPQQPSSAPPAPQATPAQPQKPAPPPDDDTDVVRIRTNLVQIDAVVLDKNGKHVKDLTADDFEVFEDNRKQVITNFSYVSNLGTTEVAAKPPARKGNALPTVPPAIRPDEPRRTIALVVDDLGISSESVSALKSQLRKFIDSQMQPNDLVAIIRTGGDVGALQQFTTHKQRLHRAVDKLRRHPCSRVGQTVFTPVGTLNGEVSICAMGSERASTQALSFIVQGMGALPGRKSMVVLSDSVPLSFVSLQQPEPSSSSGDGGVSREGPTTSNDPSPGLSLEAALMRIAERAIRASVVIYAVDTSGIQPIAITAADKFPEHGAPGSGMTPDSVLISRSHQLQDARGGSELIARETGGFLVRNSNDFQLQRVMTDQEGYYLIGYRPTDETFNRRFHHIKASVKRSGVSVRTRRGFFGVTDNEARPPQTSRDQINLALMSPFAAVDINVELTALFADTVTNGSELHSFLYFQARDLTFTEQPDGWRQAVFDLSGIIFGDNGAVVHRVSETRTLRRRGTAYEQALRRGLVYRLVLPVPKPGSYQFRVAVRDVSSSRLGTAGQFVEVPNLKNGRLALSGITISGYLESTDPNSSTAQPQNTQATISDVEAMSGPSQRRFRTPSNLYFGYVVYNAQLDKTTRQPKLLAAMRILRDGKVVYEGQPKAIDLTAQSDLQRIIAGSGLQLGTEMAPGEYILQVIVTDLLAKEKERTTTQWIDFEIVK